MAIDDFLLLDLQPIDSFIPGLISSGTHDQLQDVVGEGEMDHGENEHQSSIAIQRVFQIETSAILEAFIHQVFV